MIKEKIKAIVNESKRLEIIEQADHHNLAEVSKDRVVQRIEWLSTQLNHIS